MGQTLEEVGTAFAQFGKSLFAGTKELIEEVGVGCGDGDGDGTTQGGRRRLQDADASGSGDWADPALARFL